MSYSLSIIKSFFFIFLLSPLFAHSLLFIILFFLLLISLSTFLLIIKTLVIVVVIIHLISIEVSVLLFVVVFIRDFWLDFFHFFFHFNFNISGFEVLHQTLQLVSLNAHELDCFLLLHECNFHVELLIVCSQSAELYFSYFLAFEVDDWLGDENHRFL